MPTYTVMVEKTHWLEIEADSEKEAFDIAEEETPTFSSEFEETEMSIINTEE